MVASEILVFMFQVNHVTDKSTFFEKDNIQKSWAEHQILGSTNFSVGDYFWNHLSGGLSHHLFPTYSHIHYPKIHFIVKEFCLKNNISYNYYDSFWDAIKGHLNHLKNMEIDH
jgi:linoleoyl-CoA desaturase